MAVYFERTQPSVRTLLGTGCKGACDQGREPCTCDLAMPCAPAEACRHPQDLETTPDAEWDGAPLSPEGRRFWRLFAAAVLLLGLAWLAA